MDAHGAVREPPLQKSEGVSPSSDFHFPRKSAINGHNQPAAAGFKIHTRSPRRGLDAPLGRRLPAAFLARHPALQSARQLEGLERVQQVFRLRAGHEQPRVLGIHEAFLQRA